MGLYSLAAFSMAVNPTYFASGGSQRKGSRQRFGIAWMSGSDPSASQQVVQKRCYYGLSRCQNSLTQSPCIGLRFYPGNS